MTRAVDVSVMPVVGGVFNVCRGDGDTTLSFFGGLVDRAIFEEFGVALFCLTFGDGGCEGGLYARSEPVGGGERWKDRRKGGREGGREEEGLVVPFRGQRDR